MPLLKKWLHFFIIYQFWIGWAAAAWILFFQITFNLKIDWIRITSIAFLVQSGYALIRISQYKLNNQLIHYQHIFNYRVAYFILFIVSIFAYTYQINSKSTEWLTLTFIILISILYPFYLKRIPFIKGVFVSICWLLILPLHAANISFGEIFNLGFYILLLVLPFDIRDAEIDKQLGIKTWVNWRPEMKKIFIFIPLIISITVNLVVSNANSVLLYSLLFSQIILIFAHINTFNTAQIIILDVVYDGILILLPFIATLIKLCL
jgi:hypothetical protein